MKAHGGRIKAVDLFCGMGGLSLGFAVSGFSITGYDINPHVPRIFSLNGIGRAFSVDLRETGVERTCGSDIRVVVGGPPCRPWSALNRRQRGRDHHDHDLVLIFLRAVVRISPEIFLMENVPLLQKDPLFEEYLGIVRKDYDVAWDVVRYADYGAATARHRLILVGFRKKRSFLPAVVRFFERLRDFRKPPLTVRRVLELVENSACDSDPDHVWLNLRTIEKYREKYRTGKYGWYRLDPDRPAPSFGNISKTYILNPFTGNGGGVPPRVLSVREAMTIMGFPMDFRFPEGMGVSTRYQMVADAVSPVFSEVCGRIVKEFLEWWGPSPESLPR